LAIPAVFLVSAEDEPSRRIVMFGLVGDPADPPMGAGGTTRDGSEPGAIVIKRGTQVDFLNCSGGMHQVAIYDQGLNFDDPGCGTDANPCENLTTLADVIVLPSTLPWGNFVSPPDGARQEDDPATLVNETTAGAGLLLMGPTPVGVPGPQRQAGAIDLSYTFNLPGQYLVICSFRPHFVDYAHSTFILVTN